MPLHRHDGFHELIVVLAGRIETRIGGQTIVGQQGDVLFYPQGQPHAERSVGPVPLQTLYVSWNATRFLKSEIPLLHRDQNGRITMAVSWMEDLQLAGNGTGVMEDLLHAVLHELTSLPFGGEEDVISKVKQHIRTHVAGPLGLDDLATVAGLSRFHFARLFKKRTGQAPATFVRSVRIDAARALLQTTPLPLREIAPRVGLIDEFHLSRVFRRVMGFSPGKLTGRRA